MDESLTQEAAARSAAATPAEGSAVTFEEAFDHLTGFRRSAVLRTVLELHIADHILAGRDTPDAIARAEEANHRAVATLLDAFCALGFAQKLAGRYRLLSVSESILARQGLGELASVLAGRESWEPWSRLTEVVRTGRPALRREEQGKVWVSLARATLASSQHQGAVAAQLLGIRGGEGLRVLDVGCGSGGNGLAFLSADPAATLKGLDVEPVVRVAEEHAAALQLSTRAHFQACDIHEERLGENEFDLAIVSEVLHLCNPQRAQGLLSRVSDALVPGGRVLIREPVADEERCQASHALMTGVRMLLETEDGRVYTLCDLASWLSSSGFKTVTLHRSDRFSATLVARKA